MTARAEWPDEAIALLTAQYNVLSPGEIAVILGYSKVQVMKKAEALGLTRVKEPRWSPGEMQLLTDHWGQEPMNFFCARLGRSEQGIILKAQRLGLGPMKDPVCFTKSDLCECLKVDYRKVERWVAGGLLAARRQNVSRQRNRSEEVLQVHPDDLIAFLKTNPREWDGRQAGGLEPALEAKRAAGWDGSRDYGWLDEKIAADADRLLAREGLRWDGDEDERLRQLAAAGENLPAIGREMGRSSGAVEHRLARLEGRETSSEPKKPNRRTTRSDVTLAHSEGRRTRSVGPSREMLARVTDNGEEAPCTVKKATPVDCLRYNVPLEKAHQMLPEELTPEDAALLQQLGQSIDDIARLYSFQSRDMVEYLLKRWDLLPRKAAAETRLRPEKPARLTRRPVIEQMSPLPPPETAPSRETTPEPQRKTAKVVALKDTTPRRRGRPPKDRVSPATDPGVQKTAEQIVALLYPDGVAGERAADREVAVFVAGLLAEMAAGTLPAGKVLARIAALRKQNTFSYTG